MSVTLLPKTSISEKNLDYLKNIIWNLHKCTFNYESCEVKEILETLIKTLFLENMEL